MKERNKNRLIVLLICMIIIIFLAVINFIINIPNSYTTRSVYYNSDASAMQIVQKFSSDYHLDIIENLQDTDVLLEAKRYEYIETPMFEDGFIAGESLSYFVQTETCNYKFNVFISENELPYHVTHIELSDNKLNYYFKNNVELNYEKFISKQRKCTEYYYFEFQYKNLHYIGNIDIIREHIESNVCEDTFEFFENLIQTIIFQ